MRLEVSRRVSIFVLGGVGAGIVFEEREDGRRVPVHILGGPQAARRWTESRYQGVDWASPHRATALVGRLSRSARMTASESARRAKARPQVTYETSELRTYLPELVTREDHEVILQQCEEHVAEPDRWEPFVNVLWECTS
jgi:hypothetical protein